MSSEIIIALIGIATTVIGSWASHFFTRKKYHSEVDSTVIENMKQSLEFYTKLSDDNKARLEEALKRNEQLETEVKELRGQMFELMNNICFVYQCEHRVKMQKKRPTPKPKTDEND